MKSRVSLMACPAKACAVWLLLAASASAQEATLESLIESSRVAMAGEDWERALDFNTRAITGFGSGDPLREHGARFGILFYRKGLCEMKLKRWDEAMRSFERCYRDFPNDGAAAGGNLHQKMALLKWGEAAMGAGQWHQALALFSKFGEERDKKRDTFPQGAFFINRAVCHYKLGQIAEGSENLEIAIRNRAEFPTPDLGIVAGFQELVGAAIGKRDEQALLDFIGKNRGELVIEPYEMYRFSPVFLKLAGDAIAAGMTRAAMALYQVVPSTEVAIDDVRARLKSMGGAARIETAGVTYDRKRLEEDLAAFEADRRGKNPTEAIRLAGVAYLHEAAGNLTGACAAYRLLETFHPGAEKREDNLFNLIRVSSRIGLADDVRKHAESFAKDFPASPRLTEVRDLVLVSLYEEGDPATCVEVAGPMLDLLEKGSAGHDLCLFILGASYFNIGPHERAEVLLDLHAKDYPASGRASEVAYFRASNAAKLGKSETAAARFDAFLDEHKDSPMVASALYERAACHVALLQYDVAREGILRLTAGFPASAPGGQAWILLGKLELAAGNPVEAGKAFGKALENASARKDRQLAGEALCHLVEWAAGQESPGDAEKRMKEAVTHADRFWKDFAEGSPWRTRMAVVQTRSLIQAERAGEALGRLQEILTAGSADPADFGALIDAYAEAYLADHNADELAVRLADLPGIDPANRGLQARLRMAVITAFEKEAGSATDEAGARLAALVKSLYQKLKTGFTPAELDAPTLLRLADHLRQNTSTPREALPLYDELLSRGTTTLANAALTGRADVRVRSTASDEIDQGIADFTRVRDSSGSAGERAYAGFRIVEALMARADFAKAVDEARIYQKFAGSAGNGFSPRVGLMLARAYQELKRTDEAIEQYARLWSGYTGNLEISAPAMICWMRLVWSRNREDTDPSDRQKACEEGAAYLERTRDAAAGLKAEDRGPWLEIEEAVRTFATSPGIKPPPNTGWSSGNPAPP